MLEPVLTSKLYCPPTPPKAVRRPRLVERLAEGLRLGRKLTLISAPAGFGKTTLLSEWAAGLQRQVAWLSLDERDSDPVRFLLYLVAGLRTVAPEIGETVLPMLQAAQSQPPPIETTLTVLLNNVATIPDQLILVLDDYHRIDARTIDDAVSFLIEHLPPSTCPGGQCQGLHLVIATREDPGLPLARLRARGELTELRAADLRLTASEAAEFLNRVMGLSLSADDISTLEGRTEGWIAGLQLAALSMQGRQDVAGFIRAFAGDHRYILDYLVEEVLQGQPAPLRSFLLQTAILDQLNGPLCDAVSGQEGGHARLEALARGNFFVVPLDDQRRWYRYHHLFGDVLCAHLMMEQPDQVPLLHRRASEWYEHHGSPVDAIRHALAAEDFERAADLIELAVPAMRRRRQEALVLAWLKALPDELVHHRPVLSVHYAGTLLVSGELEGVEARLRDAEQWLAEGLPPVDMHERPDALPSEAEPEPSRRMVVADQAEFRRLPATVAVYRAAIAQALGDVANTMKYSRRVLDLVPEDDYLLRGSAAGFLGLAYWTSGDLETAHRYYSECMASVEKAGHLSDAIGCAIALADIRIAQGRLREAMSTYERGLQLATEPGAALLRGAADMYAGMSELLLERNDLDAARQHLLRSQELGEHTGLPQNPYRWRAALARIREAEGDLGGALDLLDEAERLYVSDFFPNVRPLAALKTRVWIAQGRLGEALDWARARGLSARDDLSYLREFEHITLARVLLAQSQGGRADGSGREAMGLLERLLKAAQEGGRKGSVIEILVLLALAHQLQGDIPAALVSLERALRLAEPEGYVRIFLDESPAMTVLVEKAALATPALADSAGEHPVGNHGIAPSYVRLLLSAFHKAEDRRPNKQGMIESLSERELEVLRLLGTDLSGPEMARQLIISLNTLRTHTKNIYDKLGVDNRRAAVRRAEELGLF